MKKTFLKRNVKKAQISTTLTWFVATVIVFFIMVIFLSSTLVVSSLKKVTTGKDQISIENHVVDLNSQQTLITFLETPVVFNGQKMTVRDLIINGLGNKDATQVKLKETLDSAYKDDISNGLFYELRIEYGLGSDSSKFSYSIINNNVIQINSLKQGVYMDSSKDVYLTNEPEIFLIGNSTKDVFGKETDQYQRIKVKLYLGPF